MKHLSGFRDIEPHSEGEEGKSLNELTSYEYQKDETPEERLRNLLTPYMLLVDVLASKKNDPKYSSLIDSCKDNKERILFFLSDMENFYSKKFRR